MGHPFRILLLLFLLTAAVWSSPSDPPPAHPLVAGDPESALAAGYRLPLDLVPADLIEDLPGLPRGAVQSLIEQARRWCEEHKRAPWDWERAHGIGKKRALLLDDHFSPPTCVITPYQELSQGETAPHVPFM